jgi:hypothetical protein
MRVKREQWKAALVGAATCGVGGPEIGLLLLTFWALCGRPFHDAISLLGIPIYWPVVLIPIGPPASLLGAIGGMFLQHLAQKTQSLKVVIAEAVALGAILGSIVPLSLAVYGWGTTKQVIEYSPLGASTGACCSLLVLYLLQRRRLLRLKPKSTVIL